MPQRILDALEGGERGQEVFQIRVRMLNAIVLQVVYGYQDTTAEGKWPGSFHFS